MKVPIVELKKLVNSALAKQGYSEEEAAVISEVLLYAQLRGNNQGVVKLIGPGIPKSPEAVAPAILKETGVSAFIDAHQTHAMLAINAAANVAIQKAKESGVAVVGVHGINTSSGALGYYARRIAEKGLVGIVCSGSMETVAAYGSSEAVLGTNPLAIAVPTNSHPMVFDMTTAAMAYFGVVEAATAGRKLPEGIAYDKTGKPTIEPDEVMDDGALKSFDGNKKGSGLSVMIQALTGPLMGAYFTGFGDVAKNWGGHLIIAINPELFAGLESTEKGVSQMAGKIRSTKKLAGVDEVLVPGDHGDKLTETAMASGEVEMEPNLYAELVKAAS